MNIQEIQINEIIPYENNPRNNDEAVDKVANSIKEFGFKQPIVLDKNNVIVIGHTRLKASKKLGLDSVPCLYADDLNEDQIRALRIADNKVGEIATWDLEKLDIELDLIDLDMSEFGFEVEETPVEVVEDEVPDIPKEAKSKLGEIYQLGRHRLMCGDSTDQKQVSKLMNGQVADLLITDPPYNVDYTGGTGLKITNDMQEVGQFENFLTDAFANNNLKSGGAFYVFHASRYQREFENALNNNDLKVRQQLIWNKNSLVIGRQDYQWKHEPCFYGWKEGTHYFIDKRNLTTVIDDEELDISKMKKKELKKLVEQMMSAQTTILDEDRPNKSEEHPTMKPVKLMARFIQNSSKPKELVLDLFGGSGSTLIASEQTGRTCNIMELDPLYVDVIIERWENLTKEKAQLIH